jgi:VIT1/CCC1 family predicted Fe2+/Mn2+ transporter
VARRARGPAAPQRTSRGDRLVAVGAAVFTVGLLATLVTLVPFFVGSDPFPTAVYLVALLAPVGFALALVGLLRSARSHRDPQG